MENPGIEQYNTRSRQAATALSGSRKQRKGHSGRKVYKLKNDQELLQAENHVLGEMYARLKKRQDNAFGLPVRDLTLISSLRMQIERNIKERS